MAELTIHKHDNKTDHTGAARILRDYGELHIRDAKKAIEHCLDGGSITIQVPFAKRLLVVEKLHAKGFTTS